MILKKIECSECKGHPVEWTVHDLTLEKINLLVGKNASGKTHAIHCITQLGDFLTGHQLEGPVRYGVEFSAENAEYYKYSLEINEDKKIVHEELLINDQQMFVRNSDGIAEIFYVKKKVRIEFKPPNNQLIAVSRRDAIQHPYLEELFAWAEGMRIYKFGSNLGKDIVFILADTLFTTDTVNFRDSTQVVNLFLQGSKNFGVDFHKNILELMSRIGYNLSRIDLLEHSSERLTKSKPVIMLYAVESGMDFPITQIDMSQGMFRALSLIIQVMYSILTKTSSIIFIDDIGEGLDFDRSTKLIQLLIEIANKNDIQLIMSTNDRFVMNNVPLEYWQLIDRKGGECKIYNYKNSKEKFDEFEYTGLNNFDFLATDFINSKWESK